MLGRRRYNRKLTNDKTVFVLAYVIDILTIISLAVLTPAVINLNWNTGFINMPCSYGSGIFVIMQYAYLVIGSLRIFHTIFCYKRNKQTVSWAKQKISCLNIVEHEYVVKFPVYQWSIYKKKFLDEREVKLERQMSVGESTVHCCSICLEDFQTNEERLST